MHQLLSVICEVRGQPTFLDDRRVNFACSTLEASTSTPYAISECHTHLLLKNLIP
jgi:hypothetical protein